MMIYELIKPLQACNKHRSNRRRSRCIRQQRQFISCISYAWVIANYDQKGSVPNACALFQWSGTTFSAEPDPLYGDYDRAETSLTQSRTPLCVRTAPRLSILNSKHSRQYKRVLDPITLALPPAQRAEWSAANVKWNWGRPQCRSDSPSKMI